MLRKARLAFVNGATALHFVENPPANGVAHRGDDGHAHVFLNAGDHEVDRFGSGADAVYADLVYVDQQNTAKIKRTWISGTYTEGAFLRGWMPPHPTFFVRRSVYDQYGVYTLALKSAADYEFMLRVIHKHKIALAYLNTVTTKMRAGGTSNASIWNRLNANREDRLAWTRNGLKPGKLTLIKKPLSKLRQFFDR